MVYRREIALILLIVLLLAGAWITVSRLSRVQGTAETKFVEDAVHKIGRAHV